VCNEAKLVSQMELLIRSRGESGEPEKGITNFRDKLASNQR